jgi:hydroxyethylthiazole kinase-like uncharacterized protein yjeF
MNAQDLDLYAVAAVRRIEAQATAPDGMTAWVLMQRAAAAAWHVLRARWPEAKRVIVVCGGGNNGGDGYVLAQLARRAGLSVSIVQVGAVPTCNPANQAVSAWRDCGGTVNDCSDGDLEDADLLVDAIFGIGCDQAPTGVHAHVITAINRNRAPCFSLDVPSGLNADSGHAPGACVQADVTLSFVAWKQGMWTGVAARYCGERQLGRLALPQAAYSGVAPSARLMRAADLRHALPPRARDAHKGHCGHVLIIGGDHGFGGAVCIAAQAALRAGAGLVSVATRAEHVPALLASAPELMVRAIEGADQLAPMLARADVIVLGPGLGQGAWSQILATAACKAGKPMVIDADALNLLAANLIMIGTGAVLTPHPGEAARLLGVDTIAIGEDRFTSARAIAAKFGGTVVLKGAGTLVVTREGSIRVCPYGNPGMASGGMGDALSGIIAAFAGQGMALDEAATFGVLAHALAADRAATNGERGMLATDVIANLPAVVNP